MHWPHQVSAQQATLALIDKRFGQRDLEACPQMPISLIGNQRQRFFQQLPRCIRIIALASGSQGQPTAITRLPLETAQLVRDR